MDLYICTGFRQQENASDRRETEQKQRGHKNQYISKIVIHKVCKS